MVKISDIFKKGEGSPEEKPAGETPKIPTINIFKEKELERQSLRKEGALEASQEKLAQDVSGVMKEKLKTVDKESTGKLYQQSLDLLKNILNKGLNNEPIEVKEIKAVVEKLIEQLVLENSELTALTNNSTPENYLYAHSVNVCILAIILGIGTGYSREQLIELGVAAFLHDIGMIKVTEIAQKPDKLNEEEYNKIKHHPLFGVDMLEMVKDISQAAIYVAREHHERSDGKGYPQGLKGNQIDEYAKIVATVDTYEALTHPRAYQQKLHPYEAIREVLKDKEHFDSKFLKILIEKVGVFAIGSWVQISTNEIGVVMAANKGSPLRPTVKILLDSQNKKLPEERIVDLSQYPNLYIKKPVNDIDESTIK